MIYTVGVDLEGAYTCLTQTLGCSNLSYPCPYTCVFLKPCLMAWRFLYAALPRASAQGVWHLFTASSVSCSKSLQNGSWVIQDDCCTYCWRVFSVSIVGIFTTKWKSWSTCLQKESKFRVTQRSSSESHHLEWSWRCVLDHVSCQSSCTSKVGSACPIFMECGGVWKNPTKKMRVPNQSQDSTTTTSCSSNVCLQRLFQLLVFLVFLFLFCFDVWSLCSFEGCWRPLGGRPANTSVFFVPRVMVGSSFQTCMIPLLQAHPPCFIQMDHLLAIPFFRLCPWEKVAPLQAVTALSVPEKRFVLGTLLNQTGLIL